MARGLRSRAHDDGGWALFSVMVSTIIVFTLATMLLTTSAQHQLETQLYSARNTAVHVADAGVNAYLYELRRNPNYYVSHATLGPTTIDEGTWSVAATAPTQNTPLTLRSVGEIPSLDASRTIIATVRFPTFADYMFLADEADINIGSGATIVGKVRSNRNIDNDGRITSGAYAVGTITGSGIFNGRYPNQQAIDFAQVTADMADIRTMATGTNTAFNASGGQGYRVTLNGTTVQIDKVTAVNSTNGTLTTTAVRTVSVPTEGVFHFNDRVWVRGTYAAKITIAATGDILIPENLRAQSTTAAHILGLVSANNIIVPTWYSTIPSDMTVQAAMLAQNGTIYGDLRDGTIKNSIALRGSLSYKQYSYFVRTSGGSVIAGFRTRTYQYDSRLDMDPPPMYPQIRDGSLKVNTWIDE